jgi:hypothetical protein
MSERITPKLTFGIEDKTHIREAIRTNPEMFRDFMRMWIEVADQLLASKTVPTLIMDTTKQLGIPADQLLAGIIMGCLNEQFINERMAPILGKELLPVGLFTLKGTSFEGEDMYFDWRRWYHLESNTRVNADTIAKSIGGIMKYARFLDFDKLSEALESNQLIAFKGLGDQQVKLLPFVPALEYQREHLGEFKVGKFMQERSAGFFDCGSISADEKECKACSRSDLKKTKDERFIYCRACNAGYKIEGVQYET